MAQTNNSSNKLTNLELSIQISLSGLSFCILQRDSNTITKLEHKSFHKNLNPLEVLDYLKNLFITEQDLNNEFQKVFVIHDNDLCAQVPKELFNEEHLADYLKFNSKILKSDFITYDSIEENNSINIYVPYININNFIYDKFGSFTFKHVSTILIESILKTEKNGNGLKVYVNVNKNHFEIIVIENGTLKLYNTSKYLSKEDFIYYILFTTEQLNLDPEAFDLIFLGDVEKGNALYNIAYKYIRNISFGSDLHTFDFSNQKSANHSNYTLLKSL
ncbi:DUF3822 family protein [uncultured Algibacter sp.]|uniref:DUF3822 family protein n=1 Tax=uncultured Algibacter sp. TaxID=298659 RepID=UPI00262B5095|nr:DUF3822 family protein [uncultured Algibacter sp.]